MTDDLQVVERVPAVAQQHRHRLADVEHAASADGHDQIRTVLPGRVGGGPCHVDGRLAGDGDHGRRQPQPLDQRLMTLGPGSGAYQCPRTGAGRQRAQFRRPAGAEDDPAGGGELERCRNHRTAAHWSSAVGNTTSNFADSRGRVIISATVSRQMA